MYTSKIFVTVDVIIINNYAINNKILLIRRKNAPYKDFWALPGGFVEENEDLVDAARRELYEETTIHCGNLTQIGAFGTPGRDPRSHTVSIAYIGIVGEESVPKANDDAKEARWFSLDELPELAFDHELIIRKGLKFLPYL